MGRTRARDRAGLAFVALALAGCGGSSGVSPGAGAATAAATSSSAGGHVLSASPWSPVGAAAQPATPAPAQPALEALPLVCVHGITGDPSDYKPFLAQLSRGRRTIPELYVDEADALLPGSLPKDVVVAFGYYRANAKAPKYDWDAQGLSHGSIGGCPVPRRDGLDRSYYTTSYAERVRHAVEGVKRASGAPQVDLVLHSMGGLVGRAYTRWLSLDASGKSSVRRIYLVASPGRGINALEATVAGFSHSGSTSFMRQGECLELAGEGDNWGGRSYVEQLDDDWDGFCAAHGIRYAGASLLGVHGAGAVRGAPGGAILSFLSAMASFTPRQIAQLPLLGWAAVDLPREVAEALGPSDGVVRFASSRLDRAPFLASESWARFEGDHSDHQDPERGFASSHAIECVRGFVLEGKKLQGGVCQRIDLRPITAGGRATWLLADVAVAGNGGLALQLVEETLDASGSVTATRGHGAPLRAGASRVPFVVPAGAGERRYRLVAYGESGPIGAVDGLRVSIAAGPLEAAPEATITATPLAPIAGAARVRIDLAANAPAASYRMRLDVGDWSAWTSQASFETPPLLPGIHRLEVVARHAANAAGEEIEQPLPSAIGLHVDAAGGVEVVR